MGRGELLPRLSTLTKAQALAVYLCCTIPEVAFGRRYLLSLPYAARTFLIPVEPVRDRQDYSRFLLYAKSASFVNYKC